MTSSIIPAAAPQPAPARHPAAFLADLARWWQAATRQVAMRRARRKLFEMPDFMLADNGLSRGEIASAVRHRCFGGTRLRVLHPRHGAACAAGA